MNIVSLIEEFLKSIFEAKESFFENPEELASFEQVISDSANKMAADFIGMSLTELDSCLMDNIKRKERFVIQRKRERNLISTVGDIHFERTYCKDIKTGLLKEKRQNLITRLEKRKNQHQLNTDF